MPVSSVFSLSGVVFSLASDPANTDALTGSLAFSNIASITVE
ncbi:MAG TPA: hypothetical protein PK765_02935 [bacterium]|nr:hypothetical protein [bacterium]